MHHATALVLSFFLSAGLLAGDAAAGVSTDVVMCGDANRDETITATDSLFALRTSVGLPMCDVCECDANGNDKVTATDALLFLRTSVKLDATLACPQCTRFSLSVNSCRAAHIEIPAAALPGALATGDCWEEFSVPDCNGTIEVDGDGLTVDFRRHSSFSSCLLDYPLFRCTVSEEEAAAMVAAASVRCPCNCNLTCPAFGLCNADTGCSPSPAQASQDSSRGSALGPIATTTTSSSTMVTASSTTTTFCPSCCNLDETRKIEVANATAQPTEVLVRVQGEPGATDCLSCQPKIFDGRRVSLTRDESTGVALLCIEDDRGIDDAGNFGTCSGDLALAEGEGEVLRASGIDFEPLDALPIVRLKP